MWNEKQLIALNKVADSGAGIRSVAEQMSEEKDAENLSRTIQGFLDEATLALADFCEQVRHTEWEQKEKADRATSLRPAQVCFLESTHWQQVNGFAAMLSGRSLRKETGNGLVVSGYLATLVAEVCDGDGFPKGNRQPREGYTLTAKGLAFLTERDSKTQQVRLETPA